MSAERKIFISAATYGILGLAAGFFGRTYTHSMGMEDSSHLSVLHTHILALGFFFFLIALALEKLYTLSSQKKLFSAFFWAYSVGLAMTVVSMFTIGVIQANGGEESKALVGISGLGHILITAGIIIYIATINKALKTSPLN